jgi:hypothetical protein
MKSKTQLIMKIRIHIPLLLLLVLSALTFSCNQQEEKKETTEEKNTNNAPVTQQENKTLEKTVLMGDWTRTDAPYQLKITELLNDGTMKAGYFNPKSINVGNALWAFGDGLKIYIELRDENYPGSNYNLTYIPEKDMLAGKYFQAVEKVTYDVGFLRTK